MPKAGGCAPLGDGAGCGWLQSCGNSAAFFTLLHRQVLDLVDGPEGRVQFETRHSPHFSQMRKLMIKSLLSQ